MTSYASFNQMGPSSLILQNYIVSNPSHKKRFAPMKTDFHYGLSDFLITCSHLSDADRKFMRKVHQIAVFDHDPDAAVPYQYGETDIIEEDVGHSLKSVHRAEANRSPHFITFYGHHAMFMSIDSGADVNMIRDSVARCDHNKQFSSGISSRWTATFDSQWRNSYDPVQRWHRIYIPGPRRRRHGR
jgi:hypothetical protein